MEILKGKKNTGMENKKINYDANNKNNFKYHEYAERSISCNNIWTALGIPTRQSPNFGFMFFFLPQVPVNK
jgi:hypothetical protein